MTYAQWMEQCRKQAAERQAEADAASVEGEADESDFVEADEASKDGTVELRGIPPLRQKGKKQVLRLRCAPLRMTTRMGHGLTCRTYRKRF